MYFMVKSPDVRCRTSDTPVEEFKRRLVAFTYFGVFCRACLAFRTGGWFSVAEFLRFAVLLVSGGQPMQCRALCLAGPLNCASPDIEIGNGQMKISDRIVVELGCLLNFGPENILCIDVPL